MPGNPRSPAPPTGPPPQATDRYRWIYEHAPVGVVILDGETRFVHSNPAFRRLVGYSEAELAERRLPDLIHPEDRERTRASWAQLHAGTVPSFDVEHRYLHKQGEPVWAHTLTSWFPDPSGGASQAIALVTDIRQRKAAEAAHDDLFAETNDLIQSVGPDGRILYVNRSWRETLGYSESEIPALNIFQIIHPDQRDHCLAAFGRLMHGENVGLIEVTFVARNGQAVQLEGNVSARWENGVPVSTRGIFRNTTERRHAEAELRRSEEQFRTLVESSPNGVLLVDVTGRIALVNAQFERDAGYRREELLGQSVETLVPRRFLAAHPGHRENYAKSPETRPMGIGRDLRVRRKDGSEFPAEIALAPIQTGSGRMTLASVVNITERSRAEDDRRTLARAVDSSPATVLITNAKGEIVFANPAFTRTTGYSPDEVRGQTPRLLRSGVHPPEFYAGMWQTLLAGQVWRNELCNRRKSGDLYWEDAVIAPVKNAAGDITHFVAIKEDITEAKRVREQFRQTLEQLQQSNAELEQFAYVASHDLQEPLRAISGCVQILEKRYRDRLDPAADELIRHTIEGAARMQTLINDLLAYSRVVHQGGARTPTPLPDVLEAARRNLQTPIQDTGARITHDPLPSVTADATQCLQLFQNLLGNAIKFRADRQPAIHVSAERQPGGWKIGVHDNGIGIETQYADRIFTLFQRLHTREEYPGTGIGLAICKKIVEGHGGRIWLESTPGQGTTFWFTLPDP